MVSNTGDIVLDSKLRVWQIKVSVWSVRSDLSLVWDGDYLDNTDNYEDY